VITLPRIGSLLVRRRRGSPLGIAARLFALTEAEVRTDGASLILVPMASTAVVTPPASNSGQRLGLRRSAGLVNEPGMVGHG